MALTYHITNPIIERRDLDTKVQSLRDIFFRNIGQDGSLNLKVEDIGDDVVALRDPSRGDEVIYYAALGSGRGYNASAPIRLLVGFTSEGVNARDVLRDYVAENKLPAENEKGEFLVGFTVLKSEETPGLGEKIKEHRPPFTWAQLLTGNRPPANPDRGTDFQRQFRGHSAPAMTLKKNGGDLDAITAATITTNGVMAAIKDAQARLDNALKNRNT